MNTTRDNEALPSRGTTIAAIREAIADRARRYRRDGGAGRIPDHLYIEALDEATGGYWSATYAERREWIDMSMLGLVAIAAILTAGLALLMVPMLPMSGSGTTTATLTVQTTEGLVVRTGESDETGERPRRAALARAIETMAGPTDDGERAGEDSADGIPDRPNFA